MAIDAGTVYYTVDADTQKAIDSAVVMKKSLESMQTVMAKTDQQVRQYAKTLNEAGNSISKAGVVLDQFGNVNAEATVKMQRLMALTDSLNQRHIQLSKTATGVKTGIAGIGRNAGQAAVQFQQLIGQIQGGQDVMLALSAQSADLGFVLGAPMLGAVIGIVASLAGMLIPNLFKTTDALEDVEKATERVKAAITLSSEGITGYSEQMKVLAQVSDQLARVKIANLIADQANAMKVASKGINETISEFNGLNYQMDLFGNKSDDAFQAFIQLSQAAKSFEADPSGSIGKLESALDAATRAGINNTEAGRGLVSQITDLIAQYKLGEITIGELNKKLDESTIRFDDVGKAAEKAANNQKKWADNAERLSVRTEELRSKQLELEKAIALKNAAEEGATPETIKSMEASYDKIIANEKEAESEKALAKSKREKSAAEREAAKAERESKEASRKFIKNLVVSGEKDAFEENPDMQATGVSRSVIEDNKTLLDNLEQQRDMIQYYQDLEIGDAETHANALIAIDKQIADEKAKALDKQVKDQQAATQAQLGMYNQLFSSMQAMTANVLASMDEQSSGYKTMFAIQKAFAVAQAIVAAELAANQILAHDVGVMGMGAVATSNMIRAMGYASAGVIAGTAIAGGRLYGGDVQAGSMYRINEDGDPEVFNAANGQQYMLANSRGKVVSNKDATSGGSVMINVTVNADGSSSVDGDSQLKNVGAGFSQAVQMELNKSMRQGGALWQYMQSKKK